MKRSCDTVLVVLNDKLGEMFGRLSMKEAYAHADSVLNTAAKGISELITRHSYINVDFEDVKTVMKDAGTAVMGSAKAAGEDRALRAAQEAIASPLLNSRECCTMRASITTIAAIASTIGTARGTTHGSCLPLASRTPSTPS